MLSPHYGVADSGNHLSTQPKASPNLVRSVVGLVSSVVVNFLKKIHAVGRRRAPKVPFAFKSVNNTKGACGAFGAASASTAVWETSWGVWFFLSTSVVIALA